MTLTPCTDPDPAQWVVTSTLPWYDLVGFGPDTFDSYARLRYVPDPTYIGQSETEIDTGGPTNEAGLIADACTLLASETTTPEHCYFCLWDGWPDATAAANGAVHIHVPNRSYYLFTGPLTEVGHWSTTTASPKQPAAFIWPADHAWCIASDVDPHWAGIGGSRHAIDQLINSPLDIVHADRHASQPAYEG